MFLEMDSLPQPDTLLDRVLDLDLDTLMDSDNLLDRDLEPSPPPLLNRLSRIVSGHQSVLKPSHSIVFANICFIRSLSVSFGMEMERGINWV